MASEPAPTDWAVYDLPLDVRPAVSTEEQSAAHQADEILLVQNARWFCSLRWLVVAALVTLGLAAAVTRDRLALRGIRLGWDWPLAIAAVLALLNVVYLAIARAAARSRRPGVVALRGLWLQILLDLAVLTAVIHYLGSLETYAPFMYLFHVVLACVFFPYRQSLVVMLSALAMYLVCLATEMAGLVRTQSIIESAYLPARGSMPLEIVAWHVGSVVFISATVWYLASRLAAALREREDQLTATNRRLVAATEERAQHMLHTTHQLKAPFAAIHANAQVLLGGYCGVLPEAAVAVIRQIAARCEMLSREIKAMLQLANLRSSAQTLPPPAAIDLAAIVRSCLQTLAPTAVRRGIVVKENLAPATILGVQDHALMIVDNILSNAVNYSRDGGTVAVDCRSKADGGATIEVRDTGIGIPADKLPKIFDDYFRTNEAARHNQASTGLGLAIVRQAAMAGGVRVRVRSIHRQGTVFTLDFPAVALNT